MKKLLQPPTYLLILLIVSIVIHFIFPIRTLLYPPHTYAGVVLILIGVLLNVWADTIINKKGTTVKPFEKPSVLITSGPFAFTRNPQYLGFVAILLGVSICCGSLSSFVSPILFFIIMNIRFIPVEERNLQNAFGDDYTKYARKVRRWV